MWAGGKNKMLKHYKPLLPTSFKSYHEPFFGGGAMFVEMYKNSPSSDFYINDVNSDLMGIYTSIKNDKSEFLRISNHLQSRYLPLSQPAKDKEAKVENKVFEKEFKTGTYYDWKMIHQERPSRRSFYFKVRDEYQQATDWSPTMSAATLYFLMKTGFNGVWQVSKRNGKFNTPCGLLNHKEEFIKEEQIIQWHKALQRTTITSGDFSRTLGNVSAGDFVFLDPPYRSGKEDTTFADYGTRLDDDFQESVIRYLLESTSKGATSWLSNREHGDNWFQDRCGSTCDIKTFDVTYTVGRRKAEYDEAGNIIQHHAKKAKEVLITAPII